jgi:hypothetical protein
MEQLKILTHPITGLTFKMGRKTPKVIGPHLKMRNYLSKKKSSPLIVPTSGDYTKGAEDALKRIYLNDLFGCCVISYCAHIEGVFTNLSYGKPSIFSNGQIVEMYTAIGGFNPDAKLDAGGNNPTDGGCDEVTALNYWTQHGFSSSKHKITAWISVDGTKPDEINQALYLFGNLMYGAAMPDAWVTPMPEKSGFIWDVAGDPNEANGHCFGSASWTPQGPIIQTWGMNGIITYAATAKYTASSVGGGLYSVLTPEIIKRASDKAPNGLNYAKLQEHMIAMHGGH